MRGARQGTFSLKLLFTVVQVCLASSASNPFVSYDKVSVLPFIAPYAKVVDI